jgi:hypothetical protein
MRCGFQTAVGIVLSRHRAWAKRTLNKLQVRISFTHHADAQRLRRVVRSITLKSFIAISRRWHSYLTSYYFGTAQMIVCMHAEEAAVVSRGLADVPKVLERAKRSRGHATL